MVSLASALRESLTVEEYFEMPVVELPVSEVINPYKGLRPFKEADTSDFFGREALTAELLNHLTHSDEDLITLDYGEVLVGDGKHRHFLAVVGPSGSGKSSVVRAGLVPALRKGAIQGSGRADIFWGTGGEGEKIAGPMKERGRLFLLVARKELLSPDGGK